MNNSKRKCDDAVAHLNDSSNSNGSGVDQQWTCCFKSGKLELGCMEIGREQHVDNSKELKDRHLKQPKVLKDMLDALSKNKSEVLSVTWAWWGLTLMGSKADNDDDGLSPWWLCGTGETNNAFLFPQQHDGISSWNHQAFNLDIHRSDSYGSDIDDILVIIIIIDNPSYQYYQRQQQQ
ncbi:hypothetical protein BCR42DRAFT_159473 [Absidia repens]|uniref:Uncharacterized protein n=1 Tax=Absidia repens TaxID=90262 RepID=A0A1X2I0A4_9FUNG|nr:hypothetical protein BCR42DRAFT_159473 [Absidia repens]